MKALGSKIGIGLFLVVFAFFGLKGCVVSVWSPPNEPTTYSVRGSDNRALSLIFLPKHEVIFIYVEKENGFIEASLTEMRGIYGTHYFSRLWSVKGPGIADGIFGFRVYPEGFKPVVMENTVKKKFIFGASTPSLPSEGQRTHPILLFSENALRFEDMLLEREETNRELLGEMLEILKGKKREPG